MPNPRIKNEDKYQALAEKGYSKEKSARISNTEDSGKKDEEAKKFEDRSKKDIYEEARKFDIKGQSKKELIHALRNN